MIERVAIDAKVRRILPMSTALAPAAHEEHFQAAQPEPDPAQRLREEAEQVLEAARAQGYREGCEQAKAEIDRACEQAQREVHAAQAEEQARLEAASSEAVRILQILEGLPAQCERELGDVVTEVAYAAVLRILDTTMVDVSLVHGLCQRALGEMTQRPVVVRIHPSDADALAALADGSDVRIEPDARLSRGRCRMQARRGDYDTSIEQRLDALKQAFLRGLREAQATP